MLLCFYVMFFSFQKQFQNKTSLTFFYLLFQTHCYQYSLYEDVFCMYKSFINFKLLFCLFVWVWNSYISLLLLFFLNCFLNEYLGFNHRLKIRKFHYELSIFNALPSVESVCLYSFFDYRKKLFLFFRFQFLLHFKNFWMYTFFVFNF